ncbi:MAG: hypothetical protein ACD_13C00246G0005, partial [uncultured bacterium]
MWDQCGINSEAKEKWVKSFLINPLNLLVHP